MSAEQDLKQLLQQMKRMTDALEGSSASSSSYQVRPGRGGRSNGKVAGENSYDAKAIADAEKELAKILLRNSRSADGWEKAIRNATGITTMFGESVRETVTRIDSRNKVQSEATRRVTSSTLELAKANGLQSRIIKESNAAAFKYSDAMRDLINKHNEAAAAEKDRQEIADQIAKKQAELSTAQGRSAKDKLKEELKSLKQERDAIKSVQEFETEIDKLQDVMIDTAGLIDQNVNPAFKNLEGNTLSVVTAQKGQRLAVDEVKKAFEEVNPLVKAQGNATRQLTVDMGDLSNGVEKSKQAIIDSLKKTAQSLGGVAKQVIGNFRDQLKYNVRESHYADAAKMGMSDGELSKVLGENTETFRGITGSADNSKMLDGTLQKLQQTVLRNYGESGEAGAQRVAQVAQMTQRSGINIRDNPAVIEQRLKGLSDMADRLGMVKGNLVDFAQQLTDSGDMAFLASKYEGMSGKNAAAAMDRELEARLANAKMLGQSTEQLKAQIQLERQNRYGSAEQQIMNLVGVSMDASIAQQNGASFSPEVQAIMEKQAQGATTTADEDRQVEVAKRAAQNAMEKKIQNGGPQEKLQQAILRGISGQSGGTTYSSDAMMAAKTADAIQKGNYTDAEKAEFAKNGTLPASFKGDGRDTNSSLMVGDQMANSVAQGIEGVVKTPLYGILTSTGLILLQLIRMGRMGGMMGDLMGGRGGRGPRGGGGGGLGGSAYMRRLSRYGNVYRRAATNSRVWQAGSRVLVPMAERVMASPLMGSMVNGGMAAASRLSGAASGATGAIAKMLPSGAKALRVGGKVLGKAAGPLAALFGAYNGWEESKEKGESTGNGVSRAVGSGGGALAGAAIGGAIGTALIPIPVLGTAIGMAVGGWLGEEAGNKIGNAAWDTMSGEGDGPAATLESTRTEAERVRAETVKPQQVELIGPAGEAIIITGNNTQKLVDHAGEMSAEQKKANDLYKSESDVRAIMQSQKESIAATEQRMSTLNFS